MSLRTVKDLKAYLKAHTLSPERFAASCGISNMTVRRWVKNEDSVSLPQKYWPLFDQAFEPETESLAESLGLTYRFDHGFDDLEKHVYSLGEKAQSEEKLKIEFAEKTEDKSIALGLIAKVKLLFKALTSPEISHYQRTLVLGAIIYFISPIDLIPDATPVIGYLDDYVVVSMVLASVTPALARKLSKTEKKSDTEV
jgi:uncharacterized membrane protein YkvA (DUF1232 family)